MKRFIVLFLIVCFTNCILKDSEAIDSSSRIENLLIIKYDSIIKHLARQKKYDSAIFHTNKLLRLSKKNKDSSEIAKSNYRLGYYNKKKGFYELSYSHYNKALVIYTKTKDTVRIVDMLRSMANIQKNIGDLPGSKVTAIDGLQLLTNSSNLRQKHSLMHIISVSLKEEGKHLDALRWNDDIFNGLSKISIKDSTHFCVYQNTRANIYAAAKKYSESLIILSKLLNSKVITDNKIEYARVLNNFARIKWLQEPNNVESENLFLESLEIRKKIKSVSGLISSNIHLSKYYYEKDKNKSLQYALSALKNAQKLKNPISILEALDLIIPLKTDLNLNLKKEADLYPKTYKRLTKTQRKIRNIYATTKYNNDKLVNTNLVLKAETSKKEKQNTIFVCIIIVAVISTIFITFFFTQRSKRLKQLNKTAKQEATFETEAQIARRVHDDFGAKLNHTMSLVQNNGDKTLLLDTLEGLYNQSRNFSREINEIDTGANYKNELFEMLSTYAAEIKLFTLGTKEIDWTSINQLNKTVVYKVLRELMINMRKYSKATTVTLNFKKTSAGLKIGYLDDGVGASVKELQLKNGLKITENRINAVGGTIIFDSEKGNGFKVEIQIPN